jgi:glycosyltransferase involved in cell wall biosynthesis
MPTSFVLPFFSVIIPVYNRAHDLGRAIESVLAQTCQDFEILVVDDGSKDDPESVAESFGDPRIRFIRQNNEGGGVARNCGIDAAIGHFVAPLDSDDVFLPHHLAAMKALLEDTQDLVGYARVVVDRGDGKTFLKPPRGIGANEDMGEYLLCDRGFVPTITIVVPRRLAQRVRYHVNLRPAEDTDFAMRLALAGGRFVMVEQPGAVWNDISDPKRTSASFGTLRMATWLKQMKPRMTARAWYGARGWAFAKLVARERGRFPALLFTLQAILRGCYAPRLALVVLLQVMLDARQYRSLADNAIKWLRMGLREKDVAEPAAKLERA